jgi:hypothetical protein
LLLACALLVAGAAANAGAARAARAVGAEPTTEGSVQPEAVDVQGTRVQSTTAAAVVLPFDPQQLLCTVVDEVVLLQLLLLALLLDVLLLLLQESLLVRVRSVRLLLTCLGNWQENLEGMKHIEHVVSSRWCCWQPWGHNSCWVLRNNLPADKQRKEMPYIMPYTQLCSIHAAETSNRCVEQYL